MVLGGETPNSLLSPPGLLVPQLNKGSGARLGGQVLTVVEGARGEKIGWEEVGVVSDTMGQVLDDLCLHQLLQEFLLLGYVVCPRLFDG